jgi:hypothetical protein
VIGNAQCPAPVAAIDVAPQIFGSAVEQVINDFAVSGPQWVLALIVDNMGSRMWATPKRFASGLMIGGMETVLSRSDQIQRTGNHRQRFSADMQINDGRGLVAILHLLITWVIITQINYLFSVSCAFSS